MKFGSLQYRQGGESEAAAISMAIRLKYLVGKVLGRSGDACREILKRAAFCAGAQKSAPLELTSLVTFLFSDKKVTLFS